MSSKPSSSAIPGVSRSVHAPSSLLLYPNINNIHTLIIRRHSLAQSINCPTIWRTLVCRDISSMSLSVTLSLEFSPSSRSLPISNTFHALSLTSHLSTHRLHEQSALLQVVCLSVCQSFKYHFTLFFCNHRRRRNFLIRIFSFLFC